MDDCTYLRFEIEGLIPKINAMLVDHYGAIQAEIARQLREATSPEAIAQQVADGVERAIRQYIRDEVWRQAEKWVSHNSEDVDTAVKAALKILYEKKKEAEDA